MGSGGTLYELLCDFNQEFGKAPLISANQINRMSDSATVSDSTVTIYVPCWNVFIWGFDSFCAFLYSVKPAQQLLMTIKHLV